MDYDYHSGPSQSSKQPVDQSINISPNPEFTYIPPNKVHTILNDDKNRMSVKLTDFRSYGDERAPLQKGTRSNNLVRAKCRECKEESDIHPNKLIAGTTNDKIYICPKCARSRI